MLFTVGKILKPHGLKGNLKIHLYESDRCKKMLDCPYFIDETEFKIENFGTMGSNYVIKFKDIDDRTSAMKLTGKFLQVEEKNLLNLGPDEYYVHDIEGSAVFDCDNNMIGKVKEVMKFHTGDVLDVEKNEGGIASILFKKDYFKEINLQEKRLVLKYKKEFYAI
ncbi:TPA: 16S rRNA processing protein RimM [candidate division WOR-3 bacterium]|jgi:16S rRNA processing protein RimM|uniref:Ribosome maturation factor RimM n=1 Tax=candidate division WOR-3 bacterium TaxID=2052148 RepID=A0A350HAW0_UNCW3|nr:16S rRNA processing protein RimM [candidate division WOR-3 bacterium]